MSHGVHEAQHQADHIREHEEHGHGGGAKPLAENFNKKVALLISVIALFLAISETMGKSAQTSALNHQIEASNLWNFFQAKTIRRTLTLVASEAAKIELAAASDEVRKPALAKQIDEWTKTAARYRSEPEAGGGKGEGTTELMARAKGEEKIRDDFLAKYHHYEVASAAFQIGIVLASAAVITGMIALVYGSIGLGVIGLIFVGIGLFAPHAVHLF
jgi:uncharacterized protein DUF4337